MQLCGSLSILWHCLSLGLKTDLFQSCGHCWVFQICQYSECGTFTASSFRIWNSSTGIPSVPPALFIVVLPKAHMASHSRMSGSRWVITPSWLSWSLRSFLYTSSVYSGHLSIFFLCYVHTISLSFIGPIYAWNVPSVSLIFSKWSHLSHSIAFVYFFALFMDEGFLISPCYALELCIQMDVFFLFSFAFSFSSFLSYFLGLFRQPFCLFAFLFLGGWACSLSPVQCHEPPPFIVHQALCLSDLVP